MSKTLLTGTFALLACAGLAATQAQTPTPTREPSTQTPSATTPQRPSSSMPAAQTVTIQGCIQRNTQTSSATTGATGTAGSTTEAFILANAMKPAASTGTAGATAPPMSIASSYRLDADASKLSPHVGHKVEITGTLEDRMAGRSAPSTPAASTPQTSTSTTTSTTASGTSTSTTSTTSTSLTAAPRLKVENVKMLAASCTP
jgi:hypothetical protein